MANEDDEIFFFEEEERDQYFSEIESCHTPGCVMPAGHFASDCHTAEDAENYHRMMEEETKTEKCAQKPI